MTSDNVHDIAFWALAALTLFSGLVIVVARDIVRVAFGLLGALGGVAGFYVLLGADFVGFTQVLVYIGGIMVLLLFGIMMTHRDPVMLRRGDTSRAGVLAGVLVATLTAVGLVMLVRQTDWKQAPRTAAPTTAAIGDALMTEYVLPFELISVLLILVLCGSAYIARRKTEDA
jgi:NADH:ubiquinone oxidoreductase subunit 6 (subunit J)